ncbi:XRE family transcriptional regulator [Laribacter hongkongensis]|uniref:XRE family transcriptional regulator n=2 Tax=Laribacter hongkongensis TaxID=168471 RepID=A0ABD4SSK0_9NEIS|nr:XRE family transcriptional regulator [Laribacter hongkongensis]MCG9026736.1 XRE family transcriptional regulator [Laribacter hongkongensis]
MVNPSRILFARERRGLTQIKLAQELEVDPKTVRNYENGKYIPDGEKLKKLAEILEFPVEFFFKDDPYQITDDAVSFRRLSRASNTLKKRAVNAGKMAFEFNDWLEANFKLPQSELPDLSDLDPEMAASSLRKMWGLGEMPISNCIHLLESKGVRVFSLEIEAKEIDAFSVWKNNTPFVFLNTFKSAEHSRFDACHELAHLVRDTHSMKLQNGEKSVHSEQEANDFSSAFLLPHESMITIKSMAKSIPFLMKEKKKWGVSLAALAYRLNKVGAYSEWEYRNICIFIAQNGFRTKEPDPMKKEGSLLFKKVFAALDKESINKTDIANALKFNRDDLEKLTFKLALGVVSNRTPSTEVVKERKLNLKVV